jgi:hypothetical protein
MTSPLKRAVAAVLQAATTSQADRQLWKLG